MLLDQIYEVCGSASGEGGFTKVRILGDEIFRLAMNIGEVAAATTGNEYLLTDALSALQHRDPASALAGFDGAHQAGRACAQNNHIEILDLRHRPDCKG